MSDNVRFGTTNFNTDNAAAKNSSGFNGFPFPYNYDYPGTAPRIVGQEYPLQTTLEFSVRMWWRVKKWKITTTIGFVDDIGNAHTFPNVVLANNPTQLTSELKLCDQTIGHGIAEIDFDPVSGYFFSLIFESSILNDKADPPNLYQGLLFDGSLGNTTSFVAMAFFGFVGTGTFDMIIDGVTIPVIYNQTGGGTFSPATITLTPAEYWPYAQMDGTTPVWDTASGAKIGDPLK